VLSPGSPEYPSPFSRDGDSKGRPHVSCRILLRYLCLASERCANRECHLASGISLFLLPPVRISRTLVTPLPSFLIFFDGKVRPSPLGRTFFFSERFPVDGRLAGVHDFHVVRHVLVFKNLFPRVAYDSQRSPLFLCPTRVWSFSPFPFLFGYPPPPDSESKKCLKLNDIDSD